MSLCLAPQSFGGEAPYQIYGFDLIWKRWSYGSDIQWHTDNHDKYKMTQCPRGRSHEHKDPETPKLVGRSPIPQTILCTSFRGQRSRSPGRLIM